jgi:hypothetical protein
MMVREGWETENKKNEKCRLLLTLVFYDPPKCKECCEFQPKKARRVVLGGIPYIFIYLYIYTYIHI